MDTFPFRRKLCLLAVWLLLGAGAPADAQNMSGDAREVGLGGVDHAADIFADESGGQTSVQFTIPLGLIQMYTNRRTLRPTSGEFDPSLALEYTAVPTHWVFGRKPSPARTRFIADIRQASLSPDLNVYRGFVPAGVLEGQGIFSPTWGKAFTVSERPNRITHKVYVGAGPYLTIRTAALFDQRLVSLLGASSSTYVPNASLEIGNQSTGQAAVQITGGYRGTLAVARAGRLEFEGNYNQLQGFRYEDIDLNVRLDTNGAGLVAFDRSRGAPLAIDRIYSSRGRGFAVDLATAAVFDRWRVSVRADGIGNRIIWRGVRNRVYEMATLTGGGSQLMTIATSEVDNRRVTLPVEFRLQGAYRDGAWGAIAELEHGFQGIAASAGLERRFNRIELRAGTRLVDDVVLPSAGVSLGLGRIWFDVGAAMTTANIERDRNIVLASSLRLVFTR